MAHDRGPTMRRRRLAGELRRLRESAALTIEEVADKLDCSASKISRVETNQVGVTPRDVRDILALYGVPPEQSAALIQLARDARKRGWWHAYHEAFTGAFVGLEAEASALRAYQALLVPGLLQTQDYTRSVMKAARPDATEAQIEHRVAGRQVRQRLLVDHDPPQYWAVIDEAVLHRPVGGRDVMRAQIERLLEVAAWPRVTLQVIPFSAGAHAGMEGPFLILSFPEPGDSDVVYVENTTSGSYLEEPADIVRYTLTFDHLRAAALGPDDTLTMMSEAVRRYGVAKSP